MLKKKIKKTKENPNLQTVQIKTLRDVGDMGHDGDEVGPMRTRVREEDTNEIVWLGTLLSIFPHAPNSSLPMDL